MSDIKYFTFNNIIIAFLIFIIIIQIFNIKIFTSNSNSMEPFTSNSNSMEPFTSNSNSMEPYTSNSNSMEPYTSNSNSMEPFTSNSNSMESYTSNSNSMEPYTSNSNSMKSYTSSISNYTTDNFSKFNINSNENIVVPITLTEILQPIKTNILFLLDASLQNTYLSLDNNNSSLHNNNYSSLQHNYSSLNLNNIINNAILTKTYSQPTFDNNSIILNNSTGGLVIKNVIINNYDFAFYIVCNLSITSSNQKNTDYCLLNFSNNKIYVGTDNITINTFYNFISYNDLLINNNKTIISGLISNNKFYLFNMNKIITWKQFTHNKFNNYNTPIDIFIGSNKSGTAIFPGSIYEIIIFNKNINIPDHKNIILALTNKWNITSESTVHHVTEKI